jgi:uncharacterized protein YegL
MFQSVHISMVVDRSGSMDNCRSDAIQTINTYLSHLRTDPLANLRVSLVLFDSEGIDTVRDRSAITDCPDLTWDEFEPRGGTPLLDAVGYAASLLDCLSHKNERRILAILTDGLENASKEYTRERLCALLQRKQRDEGWLALYFGANHDSWNQANQIGIPSSHAANFATSQPVQTASVLHAAAERYLSAEAGAPATRASSLRGSERFALQGGRATRLQTNGHPRHKQVIFPRLAAKSEPAHQTARPLSRCNMTIHKSGTGVFCLSRL